jgi:hypothetical protein
MSERESGVGSNGAIPSLGTEEQKEDTLPPPAEIAELAQGCVRYVERALRVRLDFSPDTLPVLDHYLATQRAELNAREEAMGLVVRVAGAYFGEVARRRIGAFWRTADSDPVGWDLCAEPVYLSFNPFAMAYDAIHHGDEAGPTSHFELQDEDRESVAARLAELPQLAEDDFYLLSTRLEVLDIAVDAMKARMMNAGLGEVVFGPEDYES